MSAKSLNDVLAKREALIVPDPETAEERFERLLPKRRWAAALGVVAGTAWGVFELIGIFGGHGWPGWAGFVAIVVIAGLAILLRMAIEAEKGEDND